ncbi:ABC transporter, solute-binding protein [Pseudooceanicola batsensis HTCC2597]|uniref:ABC transporter, solute-binding protein n=1 Tax=Pseudooceanicola batsensis (strain ATCC BAA-863 / DSM 15984 / KCTC 12145 / HTCC2597) TaxID=252305 RepID=A3U091_PSEBH|nr:TRAP transporter substrate-binding protein DctP [Pseudooceanicola batsensis]EAQ02182.1 ABC transporter, solute-binding protein [Pseudooceanicola batsensis HTCC2597]
MTFMRKLSGLSAAVLALTGTATFALAADFSWKMQSNLNPGEPGYIAAEDFAENVNRMSGGRIEIEMFPGGALFPLADGLESISLGIADLAVLTGGYFAGKMGPIANLETGVPGSLRTPLERYTFFYEEGFIDVVREAFAKQDVHYVAPQLSSSWDIMSKEPITSAADFEGLKIRTFGLEAEWFESLGASPVFMGGSEIYTALATGVLDAARWSSPAGNFKSSYHEVAKYYLSNSPMPVPNNFFAMNTGVWNSLPDDLKAVVEEAAKLSSFKYMSLTALNDADALNQMKEAGVEVTTIPDAEWAEMEAKAKTLWKAYAEEDELTAKAVKMLEDYMAKLGR